SLILANLFVCLSLSTSLLLLLLFSLFFFNDPPTTEIYTLSLHDALPIFCPAAGPRRGVCGCCRRASSSVRAAAASRPRQGHRTSSTAVPPARDRPGR